MTELTYLFRSFQKYSGPSPKKNRGEDIGGCQVPRCSSTLETGAVWFLTLAALDLLAFRHCLCSASVRRRAKSCRFGRELKPKGFELPLLPPKRQSLDFAC